VPDELEGQRKMSRSTLLEFYDVRRTGKGTTGKVPVLVQRINIKAAATKIINQYIYIDINFAGTILMYYSTDTGTRLSQHGLRNHYSYSNGQTVSQATHPRLTII
jgi:hypothetical protein